MKYLCLVYLDEKKLEEVPDSECLAFARGLKESGRQIAAEALQSVEAATTVRVRNGKVSMTDGPFAETKEQLAGYYMLECKDLDEAIEWAKRIPTGCKGADGCIEIRPIHELSRRP